MDVSRIGGEANVVVVVGAAGGQLSSSSDMLGKSFFSELTWQSYEY